jgi:transcription initiation factor TFIID subunit 6
MNGQTATTSNGAPLVNGATHSPSKKHKRPQSSALPSTSASAGGSPNIPATGLFKSDTIHDIADSLSITNLNDTIASSLASDLEYRLHQIIDEASRFTRHSRRSTVTTGDIDQALKVLNVEPLYGHSPLNNPAWRRALPGSGGPVYFLQDEEVDFEKVLKVDKVPLPRGVRYTGSAAFTILSL